jgi:hypothetical protein
MPGVAICAALWLAGRMTAIKNHDADEEGGML